MADKRISRLMLSLALAVTLSGCAALTGDVASRNGADTAPALRLTLTPVTADSPTLGAQGGYRVGVGDVVQIHAIEAPELTLPAGYQVDSDGTIQVPFLGRVPVLDRTIPSIRADLTKRLRAYFPSPQVDLRVTGFHSRHVTVVGAVARPTRLPLTDRPLTVIDAINVAGGFAQGSQRMAVSINRGGSTLAVDMDSFLTQGAALPVLHDGDVVQVGSHIGLAAPKPVTQSIDLHLPGQNSAHRFALVDGQALSVAQLLANTAQHTPMMVHVLRKSAAGIAGHSIAPQDANNPDIGGRFALLPGDHIVLTPADNTNVSAILSPIATAIMTR